MDNSLELQFRRNGRQPSVIGTPERLGELTGYDVGNLGPYCRGAYCWAERSTSQMKNCVKRSGSVVFGGNAEQTPSPHLKDFIGIA